MIPQIKALFKLASHSRRNFHLIDFSSEIGFPREIRGLRNHNVVAIAWYENMILSDWREIWFNQRQMGRLTKRSYFSYHPIAFTVSYIHRTHAIYSLFGRARQTVLKIIKKSGRKKNSRHYFSALILISLLISENALPDAKI